VAISTLTAATTSIAIQISVVAIELIRLGAVIAAILAAAIAGISVAVIALIHSAAEIDGNTIHLIVVELPTEIEQPQTDLAAQRVEIR
jgi:hypothetical protein